MTTELQQLGAQCLNVSEYVYEKLRENFDPNSVLPEDYEDIELCAGVAMSDVNSSGKHVCVLNTPLNPTFI